MRSHQLAMLPGNSARLSKEGIEPLQNNMEVLFRLGSGTTKKRPEKKGEGRGPPLKV